VVSRSLDQGNWAPCGPTPASRHCSRAGSLRSPLAAI